MSSESILVELLQDDDLIMRERQKCDDPETLFGKIVAGVNKMILPQKYLKHSKDIRNMEVRHDDVWVISHPRSGTTWTEELVWLLSQNLDYGTARSVSLHQRFQFLEQFMFAPTERSSESDHFDDLNTCPSPRFIKTHLHLDLLPKQLWTVKPKIIFVFRNPKDVVISRYHFAKTKIIASYRGSFEDFAEIYLRDRYVYAPLWNQVLSFWKIRSQNNILFLTYEEMKQDLIPPIQKVANYLGITLTTEEAAKLADHLDFNKMKKNDAVNFFKHLDPELSTSPSGDSNFLREGKSQQWKTSMNQTLIDKFDEWSRKQIEGTDFPTNWAY